MHIKETYSFEDLEEIVDTLRNKCPWDKEQTIKSLRHLTIEELYELNDAILSNDFQNIKEELGDLLLHIVLYAKIASEEKQFAIENVISHLCIKLIRRHPHIYQDPTLTTNQEVKKNWEKSKIKEGKKSIFEGIPNSLPSLIKAVRIQDKASAAGFDWENKNEVFNKIQEEIQEFDEIKKEQSSQKEEEFGDIMFSLINFARFCNINPDDALEKANLKFKSRFEKMEKMIVEDNKDIYLLSIDEMSFYWDKIKHLEV